MFDFFKNFNSEEITEWINEYLLFLFKPRKVIDKIIKKKNDEKLRQFLFHFSIYTASFIFLSIGSNISDWIRPAILNLFTSIPIIVLFILATRIMNETKYLNKIIVFVIGYYFVLMPLVIIVFALFLQSENYTYKYISDILSGFSSVYLIFVSGFAIEKNNLKALKITGVSYLILNLFYFFFLRVNVDPYSISNYPEKDPIYSEYYEIAESLRNKEIIPTYWFVTIFNDKIDTSFGVQDIISENESVSTSENNELYIKDLNKNIKHLEKISPTLKFRRNQEIALAWLDYFKLIEKEVNFKIKDTTNLSKLNFEAGKTHKTESFTFTSYVKAIEIDKIIAAQVSLKSYHNSILNNHQKSTIPSKISNGIVLFLGTVMDYIVGDLILKEGRPKPYIEKFLKLE